VFLLVRREGFGLGSRRAVALLGLTTASTDFPAEKSVSGVRILHDKKRIPIKMGFFFCAP